MEGLALHFGGHFKWFLVQFKDFGCQTIQNKMSRVWMRLIHYGEGTK